MYQASGHISIPLVSELCGSFRMEDDLFHDSFPSLSEDFLQTVPDGVQPRASKTSLDTLGDLGDDTMAALLEPTVEVGPMHSSTPSRGQEVANEPCRRQDDTSKDFVSARRVLEERQEHGKAEVKTSPSFTGVRVKGFAKSDVKVDKSSLLKSLVKGEDIKVKPEQEKENFVAAKKILQGTEKSFEAKPIRGISSLAKSNTVVTNGVESKDKKEKVETTRKAKSEVKIPKLKTENIRKAEDVEDPNKLVNLHEVGPSKEVNGSRDISGTDVKEVSKLKEDVITAHTVEPVQAPSTPGLNPPVASSRLSMTGWGLPDCVVASYREKGVTSMFPWQVWYGMVWYDMI